MLCHIIHHSKREKSIPQVSKDHLFSPHLIHVQETNQ
jgi:hypothetical protein